MLEATGRVESAFGDDTGYLVMNWCLTALFVVVVLLLLSPMLLFAWRMQRPSAKRKEKRK